MGTKVLTHLIALSSWNVYFLTHTPVTFKRRGSQASFNKQLLKKTWHLYFHTIYKIYIYVRQRQWLIHTTNSLTYLHLIKIFDHNETASWALMGSNLWANENVQHSLDARLSGLLYSKIRSFLLCVCVFKLNVSIESLQSV